MKRAALLVNLVLSIFNAIAQPVPEIGPSINAKQFLSAASSDVGLHTGHPGVSIPLFNLQSKGIEVPISLAFSSAHIGHLSEASHVGLGWSLLAGGVITATIKDRDDQQTTSRDEIEWQYNPNYLQNKAIEVANDPGLYPNAFDDAMLTINRDKEPDIYNYSFNGYSGDICFAFDNEDNLKGTLYPHQTFKLEKTSLGFKIIADDGVIYLFECSETSKQNELSSTTSWFLTEIKTIQGGHVLFHYDKEKSIDLASWSDDDGSFRAGISSQRLKRIDFDQGYVIFKSASRGDMPVDVSGFNFERFTGIELYNNEDLLIKGYDLDNNAYFNNDNKYSVTWLNLRLKLSSLREYNHLGEYLPAFEFEYNYHFGRPKFPEGAYVEPGFNTARGTWAGIPSYTVHVDRDAYGTPACYSVYPGSPYEYVVGLEEVASWNDITVDDYFYLTKMTLSTGGSESYTYQKHDYHYAGNSMDPVEAMGPVAGRRLSSKIIDDGNGNRQVVEYIYGLHDEDYHLEIPNYRSSGVLVNPSIHISTMYKPVDDTYPEHDNRFQAIHHETSRPQNSFTGLAVYYSEVEEVFRSGSGAILGKKISYFKRPLLNLSSNYVYVNYNKENSGNRFVSIPNALHGKLVGYPDFLSPYDDRDRTYMAYPVGTIDQANAYNGKVLKEVTLNGEGQLVRKVENDYASITGNRRLYGLTVRHFDDGIRPGQFNKNRYLINRTVYYFDHIIPQKRTTTNYFKDPISSMIDSITEEQTFGYAAGRRLSSTTLTLSNGENFTTENVYPDLVNFTTEINLSDQASSIKKLVELNMIKTPIQTTKKRGAKYIAGNYLTYKQLPDGAIAVDTVFSLESQLETILPKPIVDTKGNVIRHSSFKPENEYLSYDEYINPVCIVSRGGDKGTLSWGHGGQYLIAKIENYTYSQLESNSTLVNQLELLDDFTVITDANRESLLNCNQGIRNSLPENVEVTTYTYDPLIGMTSHTDSKGVTTYYEYDNFGRLQTILNDDSKLTGFYKYHYAGQSVSATSLSVSPISQNFTINGGNCSVTVSCNGDWTASSDQTWLSLSASSGSGNGSFTLSCSSYLEGVPRNATVTVTAGNIKKTISISQEAYDFTMIPYTTTNVVSPYYNPLVSDPSQISLWYEFHSDDYSIPNYIDLIQSYYFINIDIQYYDSSGWLDFNWNPEIYRLAVTSATPGPMPNDWALISVTSFGKTKYISVKFSNN